MKASRRKKSYRRATSQDGLRELRVVSPLIVYHGTMRAISNLGRLVLVLVLLGALGFLGHLALRNLFVENEEFSLQEIPLSRIGLEGEPRFLDHQRVLEATGVELEKSIFALDLGELEEKLESLPELTEAKVVRRLPGTVEIAVTERVPVAWIESGSQGLQGRNMRRGLLTDENGELFGCSSGSLWEYARDLPVLALKRSVSDGNLEEGQVLESEGARRALELLNQSGEFLEGAFGLDRVEVRDEIMLEAITRTGSQGIFSYYELERQLEAFARVLGYAQQTGRSIGEVNLIPTRIVPVRFAGRN